MSDDIETLRGLLRGFGLDALGRIIADRDSLRKALDDRHAADKKAWSAIMRATGKERGLPDNKEVIAFYVADNERLEKERDEFAKQFCDLRCSRDDYRSERDSLRAKLEKVEQEKDNLQKRFDTLFADWNRLRTRPIQIVGSGSSKLSADAPAPPQISDDARSLLDEAIAALEKIDKFEISANDSMVNQVFRLKNIARNALGRVK
jgi:predicted nuclease with TOPRIM domain